jgi:hypothetical protein
VEVVSFGHAFFYRSLERPKAFLVPITDFEILEAKETRVALKTATHDRNIKIGGGREASMRMTPREPVPEKEGEIAAESEEQISETSPEPAMNSRPEKRRDRHRRRRRGGRSSDDAQWQERKNQEPQETAAEGAAEGGGGAVDEAKVSSPIFSNLIPPPPTLISATLSRYKGKEFAEGLIEEKVTEEKPQEDDQAPGTESAPLHRVAPSSSVEASSFSSTYFSLSGGNDPFGF